MTALPVTPESPPFTRSRSLHNATARGVNVVVKVLCCVSALLAIGSLFCIFGYVLYKGVANLDWSLFVNLPRDHPAGLRNAIAGSLTLVLLASTIGVPLGMASGVYLSEFAPDTRFSHVVRLVIDVLAGIPSIIVGILAYELVVVPMKTASAYAGMVALGFMMVPIISKTTEEMLKLVPHSLREASVGLGASKFQDVCFAW